MDNLICLVLVILSGFIVIGMTIDIFRKKEKFIGCEYLAYASICVIVWCCFSILFFTSRQEDAIIQMHLLKSIGIFLIPVFLLLFSVKFNYHLAKIEKKHILFLTIIPIIGIMFTITNGIHNLIYEYIVITKNVPITLNLKFKYPGIFLYTYSISLLITAFIMAMYKIQDYSGRERKKYTLFILAFILIIGIYFLEMFNIFHKYNISCICTAIVFTCFYKGLIVYSNNDFMRLAKNTVFEKNSNISLVLDEENKIVEYNPTARDLFAFMNISIEDSAFDFLIKKWLRESDGWTETNEKGRMISVKKASKRYYYQMTQSNIIDAEKKVVGTYVEMADITIQQESIQELFKLVNTDQLTGLYNRRYFDKMCAKFNRDNYFPLAIISGDLNKLKHTNDTYGHTAGDRLIILISEIMKTASPKKAVICRHGGDEFSIILPHSSEGEVKELIRRVDTISFRSAEEPFGTPSISLGYALKYNKEQSIQDIINRADKMMYDVKETKHKIGDMFRRS